MPINFDPIKKAVEDVSTLEVATLTNPANTTLDLTKFENNNALFKAIQASLTQSNLVAYTKLELDGDTINYISSDPALAALVDKHTAFVNTAVESRKTLFTSIFTAVKDVLEKI